MDWSIESFNQRRESNKIKFNLFKVNSLQRNRSGFLLDDFLLSPYIRKLELKKGRNFPSYD